MRKHLFAFAAATLSGAALAQSSVTVFGVVDLGFTHTKARGPGGTDSNQITSGNLNSSRVGFRGTEDLGGNLKASFWLEAQVLADDGRAGQGIAAQNQGATVATGSGFNFGRRSTLSLSGDWGELRLGRDLAPINYIYSGLDPFANVGLGTNILVSGVGAALGADATTFGFVPAGQGTTGPWVRASNMLAYFSPTTFGGLFVHAAYWLGENGQDGSPREDDGTGGALRVGYAKGPLNVQAVWQETRYRGNPVSTAAGAPSGDHRSVGVGGSWNFGAVQLQGMYQRDTRQSADPLRGTGWLLGAVAPVGPGRIRASYSSFEIDAGSKPRARKLAVGYVYDFSKRTALYATGAHVSNSGGARASLGGATFGQGVSNESSSGFELGIRHLF